jgi:hypothetical protein
MTNHVRPFWLHAVSSIDVDSTIRAIVWMPSCPDKIAQKARLAVPPVKQSVQGNA